jgi:isoquinoline 1-oxidoreductase subunit alpha
MIELIVNGEPRSVDVPGSVPLMWVLRETFGFTSVKFGCGVGVCGACTVHIDGRAQRSCVVSVGEVNGALITTLEGLAKSGGAAGALHPVQAAWIEHAVPQCGYCQPGMIMATAALLEHSPRPTREEVDATLTNLCRCGTYPRVRRAIQSLADSAS